MRPPRRVVEPTLLAPAFVITKSESTARWFGSWTGSPGTGSTIKIRMVFEKDGPESEAHIDTCEPPRRLALTTKGYLDNLGAPN